MSDELLNQDLDVEGHTTHPPKYGANDEPSDEVEAHSFPPKYGANDEPEDEVEAHSFPPKYGANDEPEDEVEGHVHRGK
jgi:hypothetical protein